MPNWCSNELTVSAPSREEIEAFIARGKSGEHVFVGPFNPKHGEGKAEFDWGAFTPIQMEMLMRDDELFLDKSDNKSSFSFHAFVPMPREVMLAPYDPNRLKEAAAKYPEWFGRFPNLLSGYDWEHKNFGVKWGASEPSVGEVYQGSDGRWYVDYSFETAWAPPTDFMHSLADLYPTFTFDLSFREEGMGFAGNYGWSDGKVSNWEEFDCEGEEEEGDEEEE